jgi:hypothetical protein
LDGDSTARTQPKPAATVGDGQPDADALDRLADLIADGQAEWPADLAEPAASELTLAVRRRRRSRLVKLIARLIAADIVRAGRANKEVER